MGAFTGAFFTKCMENAIPSVGMRFFLALIIGAAVAGVFGIIIGIPVLRLKGDYLAIVTLAFGEIIKNLINVMYVGPVSYTHLDVYKRQEHNSAPAIAARAEPIAKVIAMVLLTLMPIRVAAPVSSDTASIA